MSDRDEAPQDAPPEASTPRPDERRHPASIFGALLIVVAILWAGSATAYNMGADEIAVTTGGAGTDLQREFDVVMFEVDTETAFSVTRSGPISVVGYERGLFPFWPICGTFQRTVEHLPAVHYMKGDWVYTAYPQFVGPDAFNLETGEVLAVEAPLPALGERIDPSTIAAFAERGLDYEPESELNLDRLLEEKFRPMRTINGSCVTLNAAFLVMLVLLGLAWGVAAALATFRRLVARRKRK